jgi:hypothetical protein
MAKIRPVALAGAAAGVTTVLTLGHAVDTTLATPQVELAATAIGIGGYTDAESANIPRKFQHQLVPEGDEYVPIPYPAELPIDPSVAVAVPRTIAVINTTTGEKRVIGYSEGAVAAELVKRRLTADYDPQNPAIPRDQLEFIFIAGPSVPNGGIYARFPVVPLPGFTSTGAAQPSPYDSTYYALEYDIVADAPAYFNPLSLANSLLALHYVHGDQGPDPVDLTTAPRSVLVDEDNGAGGTDTYVLIRSEHLPLLRPIRDLSAQLGATALTEPFVGAVEPTLRVLVDMGYTDRDYRNIRTDGVADDEDYQDANVPTRFSLFTPPQRILKSAAALPDAFADGAENFVDALPKAPTATKTTPKKSAVEATKATEDKDEDEDKKDDTQGGAKHSVLHDPLSRILPRKRTQPAETKPATEAQSNNDTSADRDSSAA